MNPYNSGYQPCVGHETLSNMTDCIALEWKEKLKNPINIWPRNMAFPLAFTASDVFEPGIKF